MIFQGYLYPIKQSKISHNLKNNINKLSEKAKAKLFYNQKYVILGYLILTCSFLIKFKSFYTKDT